MDDMLIGSIGFSICSFFFASFILVMYLNKKKYKDLENIIFFSLLLLVFLLIFSEFGYISVLSSNGKNLTAELLCRCWLNLLIIWMITYTYYIIVLLTKKINDKDEMVSKRKTIGIVCACICLVSLVVSNILPIEFYDETYHIYSFSGPAAYIGFAIAGVTLLNLFYSFIIRKDMVTSSQRKTISYTVLSITVVTILQFLFPVIDHNFQNFECVMLLLMLYLTLEDQDSKLLIEHEKSKEESEKANLEQTEFLTSISHEIRTPMGVVMGFSEVILRDKSDDYLVVKNDMDNIHRAAETLLKIINDILDLSSIESKKEKVLEKDYEIVNILDDLNKFVLSNIDENIAFSIDIDKELPSTYNGDPTKITKILSNLLITSIKYTSKGNIILHVKKIVDDNSKTIIQFYIETSGSYIDEYDVLNFFNNKESNSNGFNSSTLGLNVAKLYSEMIDGRISFKSNNGRDFSYIFEIEPLINNIMPVGDISSLFTKNENIKDVNLKGKTILVVDDNSLNLKLLSRMLSEFGCSVEQANSGLECIDMVQNKQYDLIFLDHMMPDMDGIETLRKIEDIIEKRPPIIALTANSFDGVKDYYIKEGFTDYLEKPINRERLIKELIESLNIK